MNSLKQRFTRERKEVKTQQTNKNIRKNNIVQVISGHAFSKTSKVLKIFTKSNRCLIEKVNMVKKHRKPTQSTPGGIDEVESSIHLSNVKLVSRGSTEGKTPAKKSIAKTETKTKTEKKPASKKVAKK